MQHILASKTKHSPLYDAIRSDGPAAFDVTHLETLGGHVAFKRERQIILERNTLHPAGYNRLPRLTYTPAAGAEETGGDTTNG